MPAPRHRFRYRLVFTKYGDTGIAMVMETNAPNQDPSRVLAVESWSRLH